MDTGFSEKIMLRPAREAAVNVKATLSPDDLARACADAMWAEDDASRGLGMEIAEIKSGQATLTMTVKHDRNPPRPCPSTAAPGR